MRFLQVVETPRTAALRPVATVTSAGEHDADRAAARTVAMSDAPGPATSAGGGADEVLEVRVRVCLQRRPRAKREVAFDRAAEVLRPHGLTV
jgi:hypothetical protein